MGIQVNRDITLGDLVAAVTEEATPLTRNKRKLDRLVFYILQDLFQRCRVRFKNHRNGVIPTAKLKQRRRKMNLPMARKWPGLAVGLLVCMSTVAASAGAPGDQLKQSIEQIQRILTDSSLKGEAKAAQRRSQLKDAVHKRFDFEAMAARSLGAQWQKRTDAEKKKFVQLFTELLESAYLGRLEEYDGEKVRFVGERQDKDFAEVNTKVLTKKGEEFSLDYRLTNRNGDWKVTDVIIEQISLVNNYRSQFSRVLARSSFEELVQAMKEKKLSAGGA